MELIVRKMNCDEANQISTWVYDEPFSIYSMLGSEECIKELLDGSYYSALDEKNNLLGYYCFGESAQVPIGNRFGAYDFKEITDIGLGIKPNLCGKGLGFDFLNYGLEFARKELGAKEFRLTVAAFNERAIKVYKNAGFQKVNSFERVSGNDKTEFWVMTV